MFFIARCEWPSRILTTAFRDSGGFAVSVSVFIVITLPRSRAPRFAVVVKHCAFFAAVVERVEGPGRGMARDLSDGIRLRNFRLVNAKSGGADSRKLVQAWHEWRRNYGIRNCTCRRNNGCPLYAWRSGMPERRLKEQPF